MTADVIVLGGRIYCDLVFSGAPSLPRLGAEIFARKLAVNIGGPANTAIALRRLGMRPRLLADLGTDFFSQYIRAVMEREDLDTSLIQQREYPAAAVTVALPCAGERALVSYVEPETLPAYDPAVVPCSTARYMHICGMGTARHHADVVRAARAAGMVLLIDCACEDVDLADPVSRSLLAAVDYAMPNIDEALAMTGARNIYMATKLLGQLIPTVVVKMGADGSLAYSRGRWVDAPALLLEPVDTTGAGDCFAAGFILGLASGQPLETCLRYGNVAGGLSTLGCGASSAPTLAELHEHLAAGRWAAGQDRVPAGCIACALPAAGVTEIH
jgi:hypothetical protein